ncbi:MAG: hypothetical protein F4129_02410 [Acidimicrobiia bacterium]|nr:hypothetical protein [Acidimicrobiia bacterium]MYL08121.1 hypothetical protein [Acidimicrobiia bacterium]
MNDVGTNLFNGLESPYHSITWSELTSERRLASAVMKFSCLVDSLPGLLIVERCNLRIPAASSLARLQMMQMRLAGISSFALLDDVQTPIGTFVRRRFVLAPHHRRTVLASAAEVDDGLDVMAQFVVPGVDREEEAIEALSLLSISKVLELDEGDHTLRGP